MSNGNCTSREATGHEDNFHEDKVNPCLPIVDTKDLLKSVNMQEDFWRAIVIFFVFLSLGLLFSYLYIAKK